MAICLDIDLAVEDVAAITGIDALAALLQRMRYPTGHRMVIPPDAIGIAADTGVRQLELLSETPDGMLRVVFAQLQSVTAKARNDLVRAFAKQTVCDHLLILSKDFDALEFVLIDRPVSEKKEAPRAATP